MTAISDLITRLLNADPEMIVVGIGIIAILAAFISLDKLINGPDVSNSWKRHDDER